MFSVGAFPQRTVPVTRDSSSPDPALSATRASQNAVYHSLLSRAFTWGFRAAKVI